MELPPAKAIPTLATSIPATKPKVATIETIRQPPGAHVSASSISSLTVSNGQ